MTGPDEAIVLLEQHFGRFTLPDIAVTRRYRRRVPELHLANTAMCTPQGELLLEGAIVVAQHRHRPVIYQWAAGDVLGTPDDLDSIVERVRIALAVPDPEEAGL